MKRTRIAAFALAAFALLPVFSSSCQKETPEEKEKRIQDSILAADKDYSAKVYYRDKVFYPYYYWYDQTCEKVKSITVTNFDAYDFFDATLYYRDRWSWMTDGESYAYSEAGIQVGTYGFDISQPREYYGDYAIKVSMVYPGSPMDLKGVTRGWTLTHLGGETMEDLISQDRYMQALYYTSPQTFTFTDLAGETHTFEATAAETLVISPVHKVKVFTPEDFPGLTEPVGYLHFLSFNNTFYDELENALKSLSSAGVKKMILDLRYNGGGDSRVSDLMVNYLAPASSEGKVFVHRCHNKYTSSYDEKTTIKRKAQSLDLDRLYVLTGHGTASASELVINGLRPYVDLKMVGDTTYGKPNGMYVCFYPNYASDRAKYDKGDFSTLKWAFLPICFFNKNGLGEDIPDTGFIPDNQRYDDVYHDFGVEEDYIKACLTHIVTGAFPDLPPKTKMGKASGARLETKDETDPHYGLYVVKRDMDLLHQ